MKTRLILNLITALWLLSAQSAQAVAPSATEMADSRQWAAAKFEGVVDTKGTDVGLHVLANNDAVPFFSFTYDGKPSAELLGTWELKRASRQLDDQRVEHSLTYTDPTTGLVLRCVGVEYRDFPTVEWTLYFKNTSDKDTPILADIQAIDLSLNRRPDGGEFQLHCIPGTRTSYGKIGEQRSQGNRAPKPAAGSG